MPITDLPLKSPLHNHLDVAQFVGLVVADYAVLEALTYLIHASLINDPEEAFVRFYELRSAHLREEMMYKAAAHLDEPLQKALRRLWRRLKAAARRRAEIAHVSFMSDGTTLMRLRLYGTEPKFEKLSPAIFDRTFSQYRTLALDLLFFAALLSEDQEKLHELVSRLPFVQLPKILPEWQASPYRPAKLEKDEIKELLVRHQLWDWFLETRAGVPPGSHQA